MTHYVFCQTWNFFDLMTVCTVDLQCTVIPMEDHKIKICEKKKKSREKDDLFDEKWEKLSSRENQSEICKWDQLLIYVKHVIFFNCSTFF